MMVAACVDVGPLAFGGMAMMLVFPVWLYHVLNALTEDRLPSRSKAARVASLLMLMGCCCNALIGTLWHGIWPLLVPAALGMILFARPKVSPGIQLVLGALGCLLGWALLVPAGF